MMEFKIGDRVRFKHNESNTRELNTNEGGKYKEVYENQIHGTVQHVSGNLVGVTFDNGVNGFNHSSDGFYSERFEFAVGKAPKIPKPKPEQHFITLKDDCHNITVNVCHDQLSAESFTPETGKSYTVYKLVPVMTIKSEIIVKKTSVRAK